MLDDINGRATLSRSKKRALKTASLPQAEDQPTVVSSADGAKIIQYLEKLATNLDNISNQSKTFIGDVAKEIGAKQKGSKSQYATFETKNGKTVTISFIPHIPVGCRKGKAFYKKMRLRLTFYTGKAEYLWSQQRAKRPLEKPVR